MTTSTTSATTVRRLTEDELNTRIQTLVARLLAHVGTDKLADVLDASYDYDFTPAAEEMFRELSSSAYLAGLPSLPCCRGDDPERVDQWLAGVAEIYAADDGPATEPLLVQAARKADPADHIRIPSTGTTVGGFLAELDRYIAQLKVAAAAEAREAAYQHAAQNFRDMASESVDRRTAITVLDNLARSAAQNKVT